MASSHGFQHPQSPPRKAPWTWAQRKLAPVLKNPEHCRTGQPAQSDRRGPLRACDPESQRKPPRGWRAARARAPGRDGAGRVCAGLYLPALPARGLLPALSWPVWGCSCISPDPHPSAGPAPAGRRQVEKKGDGVSLWRPNFQPLMEAREGGLGSGMRLQPECLSAQPRAVGRLFPPRQRGEVDA